MCFPHFRPLYPPPGFHSLAWAVFLVFVLFHVKLDIMGLVGRSPSLSEPVGRRAQYNGRLRERGAML